MFDEIYAPVKGHYDGDNRETRKCALRAYPDWEAFPGFSILRNYVFERRSCYAAHELRESVRRRLASAKDLLGCASRVIDFVDGQIAGERSLERTA